MMCSTVCCLGQVRQFFGCAYTRLVGQRNKAPQLTSMDKIGMCNPFSTLLTLQAWFRPARVYYTRSNENYRFKTSSDIGSHKVKYGRWQKLVIKHASWDVIYQIQRCNSALWFDLFLWMIWVTNFDEVIIQTVMDKFAFDCAGPNDRIKG